MGNLTDYFDKKAYQHRWNLGDRVIGKWQGIPFVGTVGNDRLVSESVGPEVTVHLDLPMVKDGKVCTVIVVTHSDVRPLPELEVENVKHTAGKNQEVSPTAKRTKRNSTTAKNSQTTSRKRLRQPG